MKRRTFLRLVGMTAVAAAVPLPHRAESVPVPHALFIPEGPTTGIVGMKGIPYFVNDTGDYFGISRGPMLNGSVKWASGSVLTPDLLDRTKSMLLSARGRLDQEANDL